MIATAEALNEPTHTMEPPLNFLADHLLSDLHADLVLCIFKTRLGASRFFPEIFSSTYATPISPLAATAQGLATESALEIASGGIVYTHGRRVPLDEPLILHTQNPSTGEIRSDYYLSDALGSITELVDKNGTITGEMGYNSFGKIIRLSGNALDQCYSYTGREFDRETELYFYRTRYYDPSLGRFLSEDVLSEFILQNHQYLYVRNNPLNKIDPTGRGDWSLLSLVIVAVIVAIVYNVLAKKLDLKTGGALVMTDIQRGWATLRQHIPGGKTKAQIAGENHAHALYNSTPRRPKEECEKAVDARDKLTAIGVLISDGALTEFWINCESEYNKITNGSVSP